MATDILEAASQVHKSNDKAVVCGHDRGARVAYRMALDHPERIVGLAVLDIIPGIYMWHSMRPESDHRETHSSHHWVR